MPTFRDFDDRYLRPFSYSGTGPGGNAEFLDHIKLENDPYYGAVFGPIRLADLPFPERWRWQDEVPGSSQIGSGKTLKPAMLFDSPGFGLGRHWWVRKECKFAAESAVFTIDTQEVLGSIYWGFVVPFAKQNPTTLFGGTPDDFSAFVTQEFKWAVWMANMHPNMTFKITRPLSILGFSPNGGTSADTSTPPPGFPKR